MDIEHWLIIFKLSHSSQWILITGWFIGIFSCWFFSFTIIVKLLCRTDIVKLVYWPCACCFRAGLYPFSAKGLVYFALVSYLLLLLPVVLPNNNEKLIVVILGTPASLLLLGYLSITIPPNHVLICLLVGLQYWWLLLCIWFWLGCYACLLHLLIQDLPFYWSLGLLHYLKSHIFYQRMTLIDNLSIWVKHWLMES
jgi:hypothetical protein